MLRRVVPVAVLLMLGSALSWGQESSAQESSAPQHIGAEAPPLAMQLDPEYKNVLLGGIFLGGTWDSRGLTRGPAPLKYSGDFRFFAQPSLAFQQTLSTVNWTVAYTPGVSVSQHKSDDFQYTNNVAGDLVWMPSARFNMHLRQDYSISDNPFERAGRVPILSELGGYFGTGGDAVLSNSRRTTMVSNVDLSYRLTQHTAIGATGGYQQRDYDNLPALYGYTGNLLPSHTYSGSLYYSQQVSKTQTIGVQYAVTDSYTEPRSRVQSHAAMLFDTWRISPHATLSVYGGEAYSRSHSVQYVTIGSSKLVLPLSKESVDPTGGFTFNWMGRRNAVQVNGLRRVSSGSGLISAGTLTSATLGFRRRLTKRWSADSHVSLSDQRALDLFSSEGRFRTLWAGAGVAREISDSFSARLEYARVRQTGSAASSLLKSGDQNLVQFALNWQFRKPLGR